MNGAIGTGSRSWWSSSTWRLRLAALARRHLRTRCSDQTRERDRPPPRRAADAQRHIDSRTSMRSSSGGCVSNSRFSRGPLLSAFAVERRLDPQLRRRAGGVVDDGLVGLELLERGAQTRRVPRELHPGRVGEELALAAHRELHELRRERGEDQERHRQRSRSRRLRRPRPVSRCRLDARRRSRTASRGRRAGRSCRPRSPRPSTARMS